MGAPLDNAIDTVLTDTDPEKRQQRVPNKNPRD